MLYAKRIALTVYNSSSLKTVEIYSVPLKNIVSQNAPGQCKDYRGDITLKFGRSSGGRYNLGVDELTVKLVFNESKTLNWWYVVGVNISGSGSLFYETSNKLDLSFNRSESQGYIDGPKRFCFACGQQRPFIFYKRSNDEAKNPTKIKFGLNFTNLQLQPFKPNSTRGKNWYGFTDDVYDCVPFMSAGVWMFLVSTSILLCIILSGIFMLASLKTNDRFDDIKGKSLVVNVKE